MGSPGVTTLSVSSSSNSQLSTRDWAYMPQDLLLLVLNKLLILSDMIRFGSVCGHWRSVAKPWFRQLNLHAIMHSKRGFPVLLLPSDENERNHRVFNVIRRETYDLNLPIPIKYRCFGSSHGWLITLDEESFVVTLINPFYFGNSKGIIHLPQFVAALDTYEELGHDFNGEYFVFKAILSADPMASPNDYTVMVIYGDMRTLAFWKLGAENWTYINWSFAQYRDLMYFHGHLLAVNALGQLYSCDIAANPHNLTLLADAVPHSGYNLVRDCSRNYILELPNGAIVQIIRILNPYVHDKIPTKLHTIGFWLFKIDNGAADWTPVKDLMDGALFLGDNRSLYVTASQFPGCKPNSVYFIDDLQDSDPLQFSGPWDVGVFYLGDNTIERYEIPSPGHSPPPIWIIPTI